ncbi:uncharacterized protein LOC141626642 isoform X2 [Silene latifolia]|uniref:uncharacterized protein LOC141626642 isoform X2 n=1 Tax=Silene latifolia TaxID=37657 RepID=UPI003D788A5D
MIASFTLSSRMIIPRSLYLKMGFYLRIQQYFTQYRWFICLGNPRLSYSVISLLHMYRSSYTKNSGDEPEKIDNHIGGAKAKMSHTLSLTGYGDVFFGSASSSTLYSGSSNFQVSVFNANQILKVVTSVDYGVCKGWRKDALQINWHSLCILLWDANVTLHQL